MRQEISGVWREATARATCALFLLVVFGAVGFASQASAAGRLGNYLALKGGIYSPSASFNLDNIDVETTFAGDTKTGFNGEIAFGRYVLPTFALEAGVGYFKGKGSFDPGNLTLTSRQIDFNVIPVTVSAKALIPVGRVDPYAELGIGAYFTKFNVDDNLNTFSGSTTFGVHSGGGINVNVTEKVFLGVEGRYVWANPSFGDQKIKLNDEEYALNGFELNGFTTMLALGFCF